MPVDAAAAKSVFLAALEKADPSDRAAFLEQACAGDAALRARVEELLAGHESGSFPDFLAEAAPAFEPTRSAESTPNDPTQTSDGSAQSAGISLAFLSPPRDPANLGRLDHYEVVSVLGQGGMGVVLKAFDESLDRIVAIKVLGSQYAANGTARRRFIREAKAVAAVTHENVVHVHTVDERVPYIVMQFIKGVSLQDRIDQKGPLEIKQILRIGMQIAAGLAAAHAQGIVHRDIKPSNILLENGIERVKITDFGLARAVDDASMTQSGVIAGTPMYMSPEQARGEAVDPRSDLFSLGSVLYAMSTGHAPFRASGTMAVMKRVIEDSPRPVGDVNADVPEWLEAIVLKLLEKKPADRFQSAKELAALLEQHLAHLQQPSAVAMPRRVEPTRRKAMPPLPPKRRKRGWVVPVIVAAVLLVTCLPLLLVGLLYFLWGYGPEAGTQSRTSAMMAGRLGPDDDAMVAPAMRGEGNLKLLLDDIKLRVEIESEDGKRLSPTVDALEVNVKLPVGRHHVRVYRRGNPEVLVFQTWVSMVGVAGETHTSPVHSGFTQLFNGRDLQGWKVFPSDRKSWTVKDGILIGHGAPSHLFTERGNFKNFHLRMETRVNKSGACGQFVRVPFGDPGMYLFPFGNEDLFKRVVPERYAKDAPALDPTPPTYRARSLSVWGIGKNGETWTRKVPAEEQWFEHEMICDGPNITIPYFNVASAGSPGMSMEGHIALELFDSDSVVEYRKIEIKELVGGREGPLALTPSKVLPHMAGTWEIEYSAPGGPPKSGGPKGKYLMIVEPIAGAQFYRILNLSPTGESSGVVIDAFDKDRGEFLNWYFDASGFVSNTAAGRFDSASNTLTMTSVVRDNYVQVSQQKIIDADTAEFSVTVRDKMSRVVFEMKGTAKRQSQAKAIEEIAGHQQSLPKEMELLDRLVGTWEVEISSNLSSANKLKTEIIGRKILGGRYIEIRERSIPTGEENLSLVTYDAATKAYRRWHFSSRWGHTEGTGVWDEATKTMTWTGEGGTAKSPVKTSMVWNLVAQDKLETKSTVKDRGGKVLEEFDGTQTRRSAKK